ncbi:hypothetical protein F0562_013356 [Nyssa sinensis]|uniref:Uncharacterized protein n=1 Tax=Nyssa sinensis TaxID=561372 RepID=A0A5J4ZK83_9ASTE|nr:hypothetical protein F0562_013356 [Nyssa sinensis]
MTGGTQTVDRFPFCCSEVDAALFQIMRFCLRWIELLDNPRDEGNASRCRENGWHGVGLKQEISEVEVDTKLENPAQAKFESEQLMGEGVARKQQLRQGSKDLVEIESSGGEQAQSLMDYSLSRHYMQEKELDPYCWANRMIEELIRGSGAAESVGLDWIR